MSAALRFAVTHPVIATAGMDVARSGMWVFGGAAGRVSFALSALSLWQLA